jgi:ABC-type uncharacterized transport system involved in gliding motility auxiliary subunit
MARWHRPLQALLLVLAIGLAGWLSVHWAWRADFSHGARASLSPASREVLAALEGPVEVVSYARAAGPLRETIAAFVARYREAKPDLTLRFVDPDTDPGAMRAQGISLDGELELRHADRSQRVTVLRERDFTLALLRLARGGERVVAFLAGHGERRPDGEANHDLGRFGDALAADGVRAVALDFSQQAAIPGNVDLVVVAGPRVPVPAAEVDALVAWVESGGALLWLAEPGVDEGLDALARALGIRLLPGTVVDAAAQGLGIGDPGFVAISRYPQHAVVEGFDLTVLLPQAAALAAGGAPNFAATPILRSSERSWTEAGPVAGDIRYDGDAGEIPGPLDVALALTRLSPRPDRAEQRVAVVGDGDFLSNAWLGNGGNRALGARLVSWLLADDALVDIAPVQAPDRTLALTRTQMGVIGFGFLFVLPLVLLLAGAFIGWRRRRR